MSQNPSSLIVAVDGGGSTCRVAIATAAGQVLARAAEGAANIASDFDGTRATILRSVEKAYSNAGLEIGRASQDTAVLGLAGGGVGELALRLQRLMPFGKTVVTTDRHIAAFGALAGEDGIVALLGTGSTYSRVLGGETCNIGGWGLVLGDEAGGAYLGREWQRQTLLAHDGLISHSPATRAMLAKFGGAARAIVEYAQRASPAEFGAFAPELVAAAAQKDTVAESIMQLATASVCRALEVLDPKHSKRICMIGGLAAVYQVRLPAHLARYCQPPRHTPLEGAILLAQHQLAEVS